MDDETYYTVEDVATRLRVTREAVRRMLREGRLAGVQLGGRKLGWRIPGSAVDAMLAAGRRRRMPPVNHGDARRSAALGAVLAQAERARERGDAEGAARFEAMAATMAADDVQ